MPRVKRGTIVKKRHKKLFKLARGYRDKRKNTVKLAKLAVYKAGQHAYVGRRLKKRSFHRLWVIRLNAAVREQGLNYSRFIYGMELAGIKLDRKMLAEVCVNHPEAFKAIVDQVKEALPAPGKAPDLEALKVRLGK